jgi:protease I
MKTVAVIIEDLYEDLEAWYPYLRLQEAGMRTVFVGPGRQKEYHSKHNYAAKEEMQISDVNDTQFDAVVIPGGYAPDMMRRDMRINDFVKKMFTSGKLVAAICHAAWVPISAGIVNGKNMTCFFSLKDDVINAGGKYTDKEVVVDGNLITSRKPDDLPAFCREIIKFLGK